MYPNSVATSWGRDGLSMQRGDTGEGLPVIPARTLVMVGTRRPDPALHLALEEIGVAHRVIGDAECPGVIQGAVYSGHRHAREILGAEPADRIFRRERPTLFL